MNNIITAVLIIFSAGLGYAQEEWELKKDDDGIKVYTRYIEGSDIKAFRAETVVEGKLSSLVAILKDVDTYPELFNSNERADLIEESDTSVLYYSQTAVPWPLKDRDGVYLTRFSQHYGNKEVTALVESAEGIRPENEGYVRVIKANGFWKFLPVDHNKVEVIFQMQADPGGKIPGWVVNLFLVDSPFKDLQNLRERVNLERYANHKFNFLVDY